MLTGGVKSGIAQVEKAKWLDLVRCMLRARRTEERLIRLYHQGKIFGGVYTGAGQEAIGAATSVAAAPQDLFAPSIRDISVHLGRGESVLNIFRQWLARATGPTGGRDGNVHYGNLKNGVYTMISHLGAMIPVVVGAVMARRRKGVDAVGVAYTGDGATSTGDFHEAVNFAAVYDVPVIVVIENNHYAYSTPTALQYKCRHLADKAAGYGIEGHRADGNDAVGLFSLTAGLFDDLRRKPRPVLIECDTLRMRGHGEHDDFSYVPRQLLDAYAARDPLRVAAERLAREGMIPPDEFDAIDRACVAEVDQAYHEALAEPAPDPSTLLKGVYSDD
jgi:TPP-dependent pyruvate/acetoin dehydrogenase alpha subunit